MTYVVSDIHGEYDKYREMIKKINLGEEDRLYVLGDVVDRGEKPVAVLRDMSARANVFPIIGNHDVTAYFLLRRLNREITEESAVDMESELLSAVAMWQSDGGDTTLRDFRSLSPEEREELLEYIASFSLYEEVRLSDGRQFLLVHAGLGGYSPERELEDYCLDELAFSRPELDKVYYSPDLTVVVGHTPTISLSGRHEVYKSGNMVFIDCAATFGGRLACLCLDNGEVTYV
ncbi:MAG: metallophosphoesterase [Clostridia bacterium]|nr:metallophosphoesterase [Clostridia bacterium]